ncbi:protein kinase [Microbispora sp. NPDC049125]|uniref:serine/threonine-protein kinase n=1 Tax=Microbispora sp. NPDC049125 TaxID=3154929 RepID=UPI0034675EBD
MPNRRPLNPGEPGQIGDYRLTGLLGQGGQGVVYLGETPSGAEVAVKVLHASMTEDPDARRRFLREADIARRVAPFCTARVMDMGLHHGRPYIVSEYVPGPSLEQVVRDAGPRTGGGLERLAVATASALAAIHRAGVVHRDLKPSNVILGPEGPVVIDFGISRDGDHTATRSGSIGTPGYMAPEQIAGDRAGPASDVFSWAATVVYAATGRRAFPGETVPAVLHAILHRDPDLTGVPGGLRPLLARCLAKDPDGRPTAADLYRTLTGEGLAGPASARSPSALMPTSSQGSSPARARAASDAPAGPPEAPRPSSPSAGPAEPFDAPLAQTGPSSALSTSPAAAASSAPSKSPSSAPSDPRTAAQDGLASRPARRRALLAAGAALVAVAAIAVVPFLLDRPRNEGRPGPATAGATTHASPESATSASAAPPAFGRPLYAPLTGHADDVRSVSLGVLDGTPVALTGSDDTTARLWDLSGGRELGKPLKGHTGWVRSVALGTLEGRPVAVTAADDKTLRVWDLTKRTLIGAPLTGHTGGVKAVALGELDGKPVIVSGGEDATVRVWDLATHRQLRLMKGHSGTVWSVALGTLDGRPVAVTGGDDGTVRVWDLETGRQRGAALTGHPGWVRAVAVAELDGVTYAVSGGEDHTVRLWDLAHGRQAGASLTGHTGPVWSVAAGMVNGTAVAVSGGEDRTVRAWNLRAGSEMGPPFRGHSDIVWAVALGEAGGRPIAVSGSRDETVRVWSLIPS